MREDSTGRHPVLSVAARTVAFGVFVAAAAAMAGCTTIEGTNAMTDVGTFEREVMTSTLQGLGAVPQEQKPVTASRRAPLVLPRSTGSLPAPQQSAGTALPEDSNSPRIDATGLSDEDIRRLRNARVVDLRSLSGRPLTEEEAKQLTARMTAARLPNQKRSLVIPPDDYFFTTTSSGQDLVCLANNGDLVPLNDPDCPPAIRRALSQN